MQNLPWPLDAGFSHRHHTFPHQFSWKNTANINGLHLNHCVEAHDSTYVAVSGWKQVWLPRVHVTEKATQGLIIQSFLNRRKTQGIRGALRSQGVRVGDKMSLIFLENESGHNNSGLPLKDNSGLLKQALFSKLLPSFLSTRLAYSSVVGFLAITYNKLVLYYQNWSIQKQKKTLQK